MSKSKTHPCTPAPDSLGLQILRGLPLELLEKRGILGVLRHGLVVVALELGERHLGAVLAKRVLHLRPTRSVRLGRLEERNAIVQRFLRELVHLLGRCLPPLALLAPALVDQDKALGVPPRRSSEARDAREDLGRVAIFHRQRYATTRARKRCADL